MFTLLIIESKANLSQIQEIWFAPIQTKLSFANEF